MAKYVWDVAAMLGALESASADPNDDATKVCTPPPGRDYTKLLRADALKGARIGIPRKNYYEPFDPPVVRPEGAPGGGGRGGGGRGGLNPAQTKVMEEAIAALKAAGATVIDVDIPSLLEKDPKENLLTAGASSVLNYGMKRDFNKWLASLGPSAPVASLAELRAWNVEHAGEGALKYGQSNLDISDEMDLENDRARYEADRANDIRLSATHGLDEVMKAERLDAILFPGSSGAAIAAAPGYPTVIVPFGLIPNAPSPAFPDRFAARPQPYGVSFTGTACSEPRLIELAYAFEQATKRRVPPASAP